MAYTLPAPRCAARPIIHHGYNRTNAHFAVAGRSPCPSLRRRPELSLRYRAPGNVDRARVLALQSRRSATAGAGVFRFARCQSEQTEPLARPATLPRTQSAGHGEYDFRPAHRILDL